MKTLAIPNRTHAIAITGNASSEYFTAVGVPPHNATVNNVSPNDTAPKGCIELAVVGAVDSERLMDLNCGS
jgi:hypothetical protein